ncbi:hypothetical protein MASR2M18_10210 [Ignavibacteria bacterium]
MAKKSALSEDKSPDLSSEPKKRGRPKKETPPVEEIAVQAEVQSEPAKKRGRPKKEVATEEVPVISSATLNGDAEVALSTGLSDEFTFLDKTDYVRLHLEKGKLLYSAGDIAERVFFVTKGRLLIVAPGTGGQILSEVKAGEVCVFSAIAVLGESLHRYTAIIETTSDIAAVSAGSFRSLLASSAEARTFVFGNVTEQMSAPSLLLEEISLRRSDVRLAQAVSRYVTVENTVCNRSISDLAEDALLSQETAELLLKEFQRRGYLAINNKNITVTDRAALIRKSLE